MVRRGRRFEPVELAKAAQWVFALAKGSRFEWFSTVAPGEASNRFDLSSLFEPRGTIAVKHMLCKVSLYAYGKNPMHG